MMSPRWGWDDIAPLGAGNISPRWGWDDVAPLGLGLCRPAGAGMMSPRWGYCSSSEAEGWGYVEDLYIRGIFFGRNHVSTFYDVGLHFCQYHHDTERVFHHAISGESAC